MKIGDAVVVCRYVPDARRRGGLRKRKVENGAVWIPAHKDRYGRDVCGVLTDSSNYIMSIPVELLKEVS